jgi:hypothetical protein
MSVMRESDKVSILNPINNASKQAIDAIPNIQENTITSPFQEQIKFQNQFFENSAKQRKEKNERDKQQLAEQIKLQNSYFANAELDRKKKKEEEKKNLLLYWKNKANSFN